MSSRTVSSFWNEQASATVPGNRSSTNASTSCALSDSTSVGNWICCKEHLLQRVAAQAEPERLERDHFLGRDVAEVDLGPEVLDEPRLRLLRRRLPDQVVEVDRMLNLVDEAGAELAGRTVDPGGAALAALGDHLPGARVELLAHPLNPEVGR